jgi:hypothetical protein
MVGDPVLFLVGAIMAVFGFVGALGFGRMLRDDVRWHSMRTDMLPRLGVILGDLAILAVCALSFVVGVYMLIEGV